MTSFAGWVSRSQLVDSSLARLTTKPFLPNRLQRYKLGDCLNGIAPEGMRMASRLIRNQLPRKGLRVRVPCPPLRKLNGSLATGFSVPVVG